MACRFSRVASKVAKMNSLLGAVERRIYLNTAQKARSNSTVAWPPPKLLRNYQKFQQDNGIPVYLKGGFQDRMLFGFTVALIFVGMSDGLYTLFNMAFPKKKT